VCDPDEHSGPDFDDAIEEGEGQVMVGGEAIDPHEERTYTDEEHRFTRARRAGAFDRAFAWPAGDRGGSPRRRTRPAPPA